MGFVKQAKQNMVTAEAQRALAEGRRYYTPKLNTGALQAGTSGSISGWAEMIEAVEACGWALTDWSVATDEKGRAGGVSVVPPRLTPDARKRPAPNPGDEARFGAGQRRGYGQSRPQIRQ